MLSVTGVSTSHRDTRLLAKLSSANGDAFTWASVTTVVAATTAFCDVTILPASAAVSSCVCVCAGSAAHTPPARCALHTRETQRVRPALSRGEYRDGGRVCSHAQPGCATRGAPCNQLPGGKAAPHYFTYTESVSNTVHPLQKRQKRPGGERSSSQRHERRRRR